MPQELPFSNATHSLSEEEQDIKPRNKSRNISKKSKNLKEARKKQWTKVSLQRGHGAPYDPVEFLGITSGEKALLSHFGITTIGQLAYFNAADFVSSVDQEKLALILDLQERAYTAVTAYVTKTSSQPDIVWGYLYLGDAELARMLKKGYIDSDSLYFVWSPMPALMYRDQVAVDNIMGRETKNRELRGRYSRFLKVNLSKLCNKYYGRLYQKDPQNLMLQDKWQAVSLMEAAELSQREDLWYPFETGHDIFSLVCHGSIVIPTGRIPRDCVELDKEECVFTGVDSEFDSDCDEQHNNNPILEKLEGFGNI